ncbi:MAG TPA: hypothetical protein VI413_12040, partial [Paludibacter sp.]
KRIIFLLLMFLFLLPSVYLYGQEEFFSKQDGFSFAYLRGVNAPVKADAFGFSYYSKKGFITGVGMERAGDVTAPMATLLFCPNWADNLSGFKALIGPSYSYVSSHHVVGINVGMVKCFFAERNFPFSINGAFSFQSVLSSQPTLDSKQVPVMGYGYTQAFFAHSNLYPFISISNSYNMNSGDQILSLSFGINVKLDAPSAEK